MYNSKVAFSAPLSSSYASKVDSQTEKTTPSKDSRLKCSTIPAPSTSTHQDFRPPSTHQDKTSLTDCNQPPHPPKSPEVITDVIDDGFTVVSRRKNSTSSKTGPAIPSIKKTDPFNWGKKFFPDSYGQVSTQEKIFLFNVLTRQ